MNAIIRANYARRARPFALPCLTIVLRSRIQDCRRSASPSTTFKEASQSSATGSSVAYFRSRDSSNNGKRYPAYDRGLQGPGTERPTVRGNWDAFSRDPLGGRSGRSRQGHPRRKDPHGISKASQCWSLHFADRRTNCAVPPSDENSSPFIGRTWIDREDWKRLKGSSLGAIVETGCIGLRSADTPQSSWLPVTSAVPFACVIAMP